MPFTLAHPAIILPLKKTNRFSITALLTGSMAPDFEFFLQLREVKNIGHHWYGVFLFDFPIALLMCFLFHNTLRNALMNNLPLYYKSRANGVMYFDWNNYASNNKLKILLSLFVGIASHLLWDGITHYNGMFVDMLPALSANVNIKQYSIPVYFLLQIVFSLLGLLFVIYTIHRLPKQHVVMGEEKNFHYWPLFLFLLIIILCIRLAGWPQYNSFWGVFMAVMGGACYSWLLLSLIYKNYFLKKLSL